MPICNITLSLFSSITISLKATLTLPGKCRVVWRCSNYAPFNTTYWGIWTGAIFVGNSQPQTSNGGNWSFLCRSYDDEDSWFWARMCQHLEKLISSFPSRLYTCGLSSLLGTLGLVHWTYRGMFDSCATDTRNKRLHSTSGTLDHATAVYVGSRSSGSEVGQSPLHSPK